MNGVWVSLCKYNGGMGKVFNKTIDVRFFTFVNKSTFEENETISDFECVVHLVVLNAGREGGRCPREQG